MLENGVPPRANTFYALTPRTGYATLDQVILAADLVISAIAAFIASQALITGMFSIVKQAIALGFSPRFDVQFTSREAEGQVYVPAVNWAMFIGCVTITLVFRTAGNLAAAYGIAVTGTMGITTLAFGYVAHFRWGWSVPKVFAVCTPIMMVDLLFFFSNLLKFIHGGYVPVAIAVVLVTIMLTWQWGRTELARAFYAFGVQGGKKVSLAGRPARQARRDPPHDRGKPAPGPLARAGPPAPGRDRPRLRLPLLPPGPRPGRVPTGRRCASSSRSTACSPRTSRCSTSTRSRWPRSHANSTFDVINLGRNIVSVSGTYGYMERPDIRGALRELQMLGEVNIPSDRWIVVIGEEDIIVGRRPPGAGLAPRCSSSASR